MTFVDHRYGGQRIPAIGHMSGIYVFTCLPTGKIYVGSAKRLRNRELDHRKQLRAGKHTNYRFQQAWNRYGEDSFTFTVLLVCEPKDLLMYEQRAFDVLQPTINMLKVAGSSLGRKYSPEAYERVVAAARASVQRPEVRAKMSASARGRTFSPEYREKIRAALKGRPRPPEVIAKIVATRAAKRGNKPAAQQSPRRGLGRHPDWKMRLSVVMKGRKHTLETRAKMSASRKGKFWGTRANRKGVPLSAEVRAKISLAKRGKAQSAAHTAAVTAARRKAYQDRTSNPSQGVLAF